MSFQKHIVGDNMEVLSIEEGFPECSGERTDVCADCMWCLVCDGDQDCVANKSKEHRWFVKILKRDDGTIKEYCVDSEGDSVIG